MGIIVGIDEVGRGSWAGPVVAAAVLLRSPVKGLTDSKLLTKIQREKLASEIKKSAIWAIGSLPAEYVDSFGLTKAIAKAMEQALAQFNCNYDEVIIDGKYNFIPADLRVKTMIKADLYIPAVSAASILAKVTRDKFMTEQAAVYPNYGFENNAGYGTLAHRLALKQHGICKLHRLSYKPIRELLL